MVDSIKITALQDIGANIAYTTLVPVVDMNGTPTTKKSTLQNVGNLILSGAGGSYFPRAAQANLALSVANAAQPNITSVGTLTSLAVIGNISTGAGIFIGNAAGLVNVPGANVTGTVANAVHASSAGTAGTATSATTAGTVTTGPQPNITSVGTLTSLAVTGGGVFGSVNGGNIVSANYFVGDGGLLSNITVPTVGNIASLNLNGNGQTWLAGNGVFANISIPTVGNIAVLNLTGSTSNVLYGNGVFAPVTTGAGGSNTQIQFNASGSLSGSANLVWDSAYETLKTPRINIANAINSSASQIGITPGALPNGQGPTWTFDSDGGLYWPASGGALWVIEPNPAGEFEFKSTSNIVISTDISNANSHFTFDSDGIFTAPSNVNLLGSRLNVGPDALNVTTLLNPTLVIANTGAQFIQAAIINNDATGSSDWAAEGSGGGDDEAWVDMGFTGHSFNDPNYTITGPGDGYVFVQGYANGIGGHMVLATGNLGVENDIIFATGGFSSSDEFARIDHANSLLYFTRTGSGIKFNDDTIQDTAGIVWTSAPVSNTSPGTPGQAAYDAGGNLFVCVATNTWSKFSGTTSW